MVWTKASQVTGSSSGRTHSVELLISCSTASILNSTKSFTRSINNSRSTGDMWRHEATRIQWDTESRSSTHMRAHKSTHTHTHKHWLCNECINVLSGAELQDVLYINVWGIGFWIFCLPSVLSIRLRYLSMLRDVQLREVSPGCIASSTYKAMHMVISLILS